MCRAKTILPKPARYVHARALPVVLATSVHSSNRDHVLARCPTCMFHLHSARKNLHVPALSYANAKRLTTESFNNIHEHVLLS